uniref:Rho GTPase-activating protein 32-like n=1 Tax=Saccoglossus kowalevskii TaxID=10224 RepID=A0ABM0MUX2_SACKO|nr:PREDICTED: rho GTPase-activating protein 32-like [Saccoglossus kowalevskii]
MRPVYEVENDGNSHSHGTRVESEKSVFYDHGSPSHSTRVESEKSVFYDHGSPSHTSSVRGEPTGKSIAYYSSSSPSHKGNVRVESGQSVFYGSSPSHAGSVRVESGQSLFYSKVDNHGNHLIVSEESAINIPAVAAAHVVKRYVAQSNDELSLQVGDIVSVIDMPPIEDTNWWRGKKGFEVGFFPCSCVQVIGGSVPTCVVSKVPKTPKPVLRKHGKLILFLRSFILARPAKRRLKQSGILRERVYGCDLGEHLLNSEHDVPQVLKICCEFIEKYGIGDGIYRLSGVASNIQKLRALFDSENVPDMEEYIYDIHSVSSVVKLYFRELPNPLLTYQLYDKFAAAISNEETRLLEITNVIQQLPPPHYRTVEYLMKHLNKMASFKDQTAMHSKNLAIVWAPNLLRSKEIELGVAAFMEIRVQSVVVEYLIRNVDLIFSDKLQSQLAKTDSSDAPGSTPLNRRARPKSLVLSTPAKLLSLEEARARSGLQSVQDIPVNDRQRFIEVGGGPSALPKQYHTVIDFPFDRKRSGSTSSKTKKSPSGWKSFFAKSKPTVDGKRKMLRKSSIPVPKEICVVKKRSSLRSVRSAESLMSGSDNSDGTTIVNPYAEGDVLQRRGSDSSLPKSTSHNSFFEGESAVAAMTSDMTPPDLSFIRPIRRSVSVHRQRSNSETAPSVSHMDFILQDSGQNGEKRFRHSDTPTMVRTSTKDCLVTSSAGVTRRSLTSPLKEREQYTDLPPLPRSVKSPKKTSPVYSTQSSVSSQSSNSPDSWSKSRNRHAVLLGDELAELSVLEMERMDNIVPSVVQTNSQESDFDSNSKEHKMPTIRQSRPMSDEELQKHASVAHLKKIVVAPEERYRAQLELNIDEEVSLAKEEDFQITPYSTIKKNYNNFDFNDEDLLTTPTIVENPFNLDVMMSEFDSVREKYLRQESLSPVFSGSGNGTPSPRPGNSPVMFSQTLHPIDAQLNVPSSKSNKDVDFQVVRKSSTSSSETSGHVSEEGKSSPLPDTSPSPETEYEEQQESHNKENMPVTSPVESTSPPVPHMPEEYLRTIFPDSPSQLSLTSPSPELRIPLPPSPPSELSHGSISRNVFTFENAQGAIIEPVSPAVTSSASYVFPSMLEIKSNGGSSSSSSLSTRTPSSPVSPISPLSDKVVDKPPVSPRKKIPVSPVAVKKCERQSSLKRNVSPTNIAYAERVEKMKSVAAKMSTHHDDFTMYEKYKGSSLEADTQFSDGEQELLLENRYPSYYDNATLPDTDPAECQEGPKKFPQEEHLHVETREYSSDESSDDFEPDETRLSVATLASQYDNLDGDESDGLDDSATHYENVGHNDSYNIAVGIDLLSPLDPEIIEL